MTLFQEFKKFISRGNVIDMAVGIILGASFTKIVDVLVNNVLMPPIGFLIGGVDFSSFKFTIQNATKTTPAITIDCGLFINTVVNFFIVGFSVFILVKVLNKFYLKKGIFIKKNCPECKMDIPADARRCGYCTSALLSSNQETDETAFYPLNSEQASPYSKT